MTSPHAMAWALGSVKPGRRGGGEICQPDLQPVERADKQAYCIACAHSQASEAVETRGLSMGTSRRD